MTERIIIGDIDIDFANRDDILQHINHIPASRIVDGQILPHNTGIYVQQIPQDPVSGMSSIDYKQAEQLGYCKLDFLNLSLYENVRDHTHLQQLVAQEPIWDLLLDEKIVSELYQLSGHVQTVKKMQPRSIEQLAMTIAIIRPGKKHLIGQPWSVVQQQIWQPSSDGYVYKKSHATSYALGIVVQLNSIAQKLSLI